MQSTPGRLTACKMIVFAAAGSGKTSGIVYACYLLYKLATSPGAMCGKVKAFAGVLTRTAQQELVLRGAAASGVTTILTFHALGKRILWVRDLPSPLPPAPFPHPLPPPLAPEPSLLHSSQRHSSSFFKEHEAMAGDKKKDPFDPAIISQKSRLLVAFVLDGHKHKGALVKLYREYVDRLVSLAKARGIGCPTEESFFSLDVLGALSAEYNLQTIIEACYSGLLRLAEKLALPDDEFGTEENRLEFGITLASNVLSTSIDVATSLTVNGKSHLFNEVTQQRVPLPVYDQMDLVYLPVYLGLDLGSYTHVLVDELQDAFHIIWLFIQQMLLKGANLLMVGDFAQSIFFWAGGSQVC